jgi:uncharacterized membrane protein YqhA
LHLAVVVCLVLLALLVVVQVAHIHSDPVAADHCPLCVSMHSAVPVTVAAAIIVLVQIGLFRLVAVEHVVVFHRHPKLFIRPPPYGC